MGGVSAVQDRPPDTMKTIIHVLMLLLIIGVAAAGSAAENAVESADDDAEGEKWCKKAKNNKDCNGKCKKHTCPHCAPQSGTTLNTGACVKKLSDPLDGMCCCTDQCGPNLNAFLGQL